MKRYDVVIAGGGVAGLTAALYAAKAGRSVVLLEKNDRLGGRAMTFKKNSAYFNMGGHALYEGDARHTFRELGVMPEGSQPSISGFALWKGQLLTLPSGFGSLLATSMLSWRSKLALAAWLTGFGKLDTHAHDGISLREWVEPNVQDPMMRHLFYSLFRTATYVAGPDLVAAGPALRQLQQAMAGIVYFDRGWGTLIESMRELAERWGVEVRTRHAVRTVEHRDGRVVGVVCNNGVRIEADHAVMTASPDAICRLVPGAEETALRVWRDQAQPVTVACLDVALRRLPQPKRQLVYGIDRPLFYSNQSRAAHLSDDGAQIVSMFKYQGPVTDAGQDLRELEELLDLVQPGWRGELVARQYLPKATVCHDFMHVRRQDNPGPAVPEIRGLYVAGEWAGHGEHLVDAATASAKRAVRHMLALPRNERTDSHGHRSIV